MTRPADFLNRHRNLLLMAILCSTLCLSSAMNQRRLENSQGATSLPVMKTQSTDAAPVAAYIDARDAAYQQDVAALTALCAQESVDARTRDEAAQTLSRIVSDHAAQQALESALAQSALAPCACVVSGGSVTIITHQTAVSAEASALALTLAAAHAGAAPSDVRIITAE